MHPMYEYVTMSIILVVHRAMSCCVTSPQDVLSGSVGVPKTFCSLNHQHLPFSLLLCKIRIVGPGCFVIVACTMNRQQSSPHCLQSIGFLLKDSL